MACFFQSVCFAMLQEDQLKVPIMKVISICYQAFKIVIGAQRWHFLSTAGYQIF